MDSLTQIVLGASVAEASLGKKIGNKAIVLGAIAGTIPDLDIITKFFLGILKYMDMKIFHLKAGFCFLLIIKVLF